MSELSMKAAEMIDMLPSDDQKLAYELIKRLVLAWDPDFTKTTPAEEAEIQAGEQETEWIPMEDAAAMLGVKLDS